VNKNKMYKYGLKLWSVNDSYLNESAKGYREGKFDYIELYIVPGSYNKYGEMWLSLKDKHRIPFIIHAPHFAHGFNLAKKDCAESNSIMYKEVKDFADRLAAKYIVFHCGIEGDIGETAKQLMSFKEPRILVENTPYKVFSDAMSSFLCRGAIIDEINFVLKETGCGLCLDFGHAICAANSLKKDPYEHVKKFNDLGPAMYHLTDVDDIGSEFDSHQHMGHGELDTNKILKNIPADALITVETEKSSKDSLDDFVDDVSVIEYAGRKNG
jgi:deoxyribonuclease-4